MKSINPKVLIDNLFPNKILIEIEDNLKINDKKTENQISSKFNKGRWSLEEHKKFITGILEYGNDWRKVQKHIKTRSSTQARSHAQKFFLRIKNDLKLNGNKNTIFEYKENFSIKFFFDMLNKFEKNQSNYKEGKLNQEQKEKLIKILSNFSSYDESNSIDSNESNNISKININTLDLFENQKNNLIEIKPKIKKNELIFKIIKDNLNRQNLSKHSSSNLSEISNQNYFIGNKRNEDNFNSNHKFNFLETNIEDKINNPFTINFDFFENNNNNINKLDEYETNSLFDLNIYLKNDSKKYHENNLNENF
jgi:SHAQKYF class myb-like DNA-binding protein